MERGKKKVDDFERAHKECLILVSGFLFKRLFSSHAVKTSGGWMIINYFKQNVLSVAQVTDQINLALVSLGLIL